MRHACDGICESVELVAVPFAEIGQSGQRDRTFTGRDFDPSTYARASVHAAPAPLQRDRRSQMAPVQPMTPMTSVFGDTSANPSADEEHLHVAICPSETVCRSVSREHGRRGPISYACHRMLQEHGHPIGH